MPSADAGGRADGLEGAEHAGRLRIASPREALGRRARSPHLMKLVSMMPAMSGIALMMPISSSRSAASLEKA